MPWQKSDNLAGFQLQRHGLAPALLAGRICKQAETLYPDLFSALSCRNGVLKLRVEVAKVNEFRRIEGKLLQEIQAFVAAEKLPPVTRIQLTVQHFSDTV